MFPSTLRALRIVRTALPALSFTLLLTACGPIAGDILAGWTDAQMLTFFDVDKNGTASTQELRKGLSKIVVKVVSRDPAFDLDGNGTVARSDIKAAVTFIRGTLQASCGNNRQDVWEECDDGNTVSGDGCSGTNYPNGACLIEHCGDAYVDSDGIPDPRGGGALIMPPEQCDDGGKCVGGVNDGKPCTSFGGAVAERQCPGGSCGMFSFDGCQSNCLLEICGNGTWEGNGLDGKPGKGGIDDDQNGTVDDDSELWAAGSDDEECDMGGTCMKNGAPFQGYDCSPTGSDACRQNGGTCVAQTANGCTNTCTRDVWNFLHVANGSTQADTTVIPVGTKKVIGTFRFSADKEPLNYLPYLVEFHDVLFTVRANNVSIATPSVTMLGATAQCTVRRASDGSLVSDAEVTGTFLLQCAFDPENNPARVILGKTIDFSVEATVLDAAVVDGAPSNLQVAIENISTSETAFGRTQSHLRWAARSGPQKWMQYRIKDNQSEVVSTYYGDLPPRCGDGTCQQGETFATCSSDCQPVCGNGAREGSEQCDDGNTVAGDRCSATCTGFTLNAYVKSLADTNADGTVSDAEALVLTLDVVDADQQPYQNVKHYDVDDPDGNTFIDGDGDVDTTDVNAIIGALESLAP